MKDEHKTKEQLINELVELCQRIAGLEAVKTERKRVEEALRESEEKYRALVENSPNGIYISDAERFIYVNQRLCEITGFSEDELLNMTDPVGTLFAPEERERVLAYALRRLDGKPAPTSYEARGIRKGGEEALLKLTVLSIALSGRRVLQGTVEDITARLRAEEMLRESEEKYRNLANTVNDLVFSVDIEGNILFANTLAKKFTGYEPEETIGHNFAEYVHPDDVPCLLANIQQVLSGESLENIRGVGRDVEYRMVRRDGKVIWVEVRSQPIRDTQGEIAGFSGVARDITERKQAEEQIKASLQEKEMLLKEIHYRIKNNLQVVSSLLKLQSEYIGDKQGLDVLKGSQDQVKSIALVHERLYRSQDLARVDMAEYIQGLVAYLRRSYSAYGIAFRIDAADIALDIDMTMPCGLILNELISNALKHAFPPGGDWSASQPGRVCIAIRSDGDKIELTVSDNGVGLPADLDLENVESFGLMLVHLLTQQLDGTLEVERGEGTTFRLAFAAPQARS